MNQTAFALVKKYEGCKLSAYLDIGGVPTIGYGATGPDIHLGLVWTQAQADARLQRDLRAVENEVRSLVHIALSDVSLGALISLEYNANPPAQSTIYHMINTGKLWGIDEPSAITEWLKWDHVHRQEVKGLLRRRLDEARTFLEGLS